MANESTGDPAPELAAVFSAVEDPDRGRRLLPRLLSLLDSDEERHRLSACWAICHVLEANPDMASYLVGRLLDRLADDPALPVELLATYVWTHHPEIVDEEIQARAAERDSYSPPSLSGPGAGSRQRQTGAKNRPVGRTLLAGEGTESGPQRVYMNDEASDPEATNGTGSGSGGTAAGDEAGSAAGSDADPDVEAAETDPLAPDPGVSNGRPELLTVIAYQSVFDSLSVVAGRERTRYADVYRTLGVWDGDDIGVGLALFHRPSEHRERFADNMANALDRWRSIADHDNVVTLYDFGVEPRLWATTEYTDLTLADRERLPVDLAHWNAIALADALATVHENGIVHGGIDPDNVAYYGNVLDDSERQPPLLTNVSLLHVFRQYFDPAKRLDPRYAAPEYFDRRYGQIDHATDIYHLGGIVYQLFTGRAPFVGDYQTVRQAIVDGDRRPPSAVAEVPAGIDDIVRKAMATEKLRRYETVSSMRAELRAIEATNGGGQ